MHRSGKRASPALAAALALITGSAHAAIVDFKVTGTIAILNYQSGVSATPDRLGSTTASWPSMCSVPPRELGSISRPTLTF